MNYRGSYRIRADHNKQGPEILHPNDAIIRVTRIISMISPRLIHIL